MDRLAPIVLFVYNRPEHTLKTLKALQRNPLARDSVLYVFADGAHPNASPEQLAKIAEVRRIVRAQKWCRETCLSESNMNQGLADSIVAGVTRIVEKHGRVIVLEDDISLSPAALDYFNAALSLYEWEDRVMQISGFMVPNSWRARQTGFLRMTTSWGWATWKRAWQHYNGDAGFLRRSVEAKNSKAFDMDGASFHFDELCRNERGELKTWAVKWYASVYLANGLCLYPKTSLVKNTGFDGSGVNCGNDDTGYFDKTPRGARLAVRPVSLAEDPVYLRAMRRSFQYRFKIWTKTRFRDRLRRKIAALVGYKP